MLQEKKGSRSCNRKEVGGTKEAQPYPFSPPPFRPSLFLAEAHHPPAAETFLSSSSVRQESERCHVPLLLDGTAVTISSQLLKLPLQP
jgi:hypothetical protein